MEKVTGIIGAMPEEIAFILENAVNSEKTIHAGAAFYKAEIAGKNCVIAQSGIGKVNAAVTTQVLIDKFGVNQIIFTGLAGGVRHGLKIGDMILAESLIQHDFDLTKFGREKGYIPNVGKFLKADENLNRKIEECCLELLNEDPSYPKLSKGIIVSGDVFVADPLKVEELGREFNAAATEMEGGAVAQVCILNKIAFAVVRTISDSADEHALVDFKSILDKASIREYSLIKKLLPKI